MKRSPPFRLIATGLAVILAGLAYDVSFAGLPYQDPTAEMRADWLFHKTVSERVMLAGLAILAASCAWAGLQLVARVSSWGIGPRDRPRRR